MTDLPTEPTETRSVPAPLLSKRTGARFASKPTSDDWDDNEPMELAIAVALRITAGLSEKALRTAIRKRDLAYSSVAGRLYVTKRALREMFEPKLKTQNTVAVAAVPEPDEPQHEGRSAIEDQLEWEHTAHKRKNSRRRHFN